MTIRAHRSPARPHRARRHARRFPPRPSGGPRRRRTASSRARRAPSRCRARSTTRRATPRSSQQYEEIPEGVLVPAPPTPGATRTYFFDAKTIDIGYDDQFLGGRLRQEGRFPARPELGPEPQLAVEHGAHALHRDLARASSACPTRCGSRCRTSTCPGSRPRPRNPVGTGTAPANPTVPGFYAVEDYVNLGLPTFDLRYVRKTGRAGFEVPVGKSLVLNASYARETRDGNKNTTFYGGPDYEVATPIDYVTDNFRFGGDFAKGRFFFGRVRGLQPVHERGALRRDRQPRAAGDGQPDERPRDLQRRRVLPALRCRPTTRPGRPTSPAASRCPRGTSSRRSLSTGNMSMDTRCCRTSRPTPTCRRAPPRPTRCSPWCRPTAASRPSTTRSWAR